MLLGKQLNTEDVCAVDLWLWAEDSTVQLMMLSIVKPQRTVSSEGFGGKAVNIYFVKNKV